MNADLIVDEEKVLIGCWRPSGRKHWGAKTNRKIVAKNKKLNINTMKEYQAIWAGTVKSIP
jgi:hypothetical protein